jgi:hypothetical protein
VCDESCLVKKIKKNVFSKNQTELKIRLINKTIYLIHSSAYDIVSEMGKQKFGLSIILSRAVEKEKQLSMRRFLSFKIDLNKKY